MALTAKIDTTGWDALRARVFGLRRKNLGLGIFGNGELATIAATHEYGSDDGVIPERSYIRATLNGDREEFTRVIARLSGQLMAGTIDAERALGILGEFGVKMIKRRIRSNIPPPLKPATIARKGSSVALIDTGRLWNAITWRIVA